MIGKINTIKNIGNFEDYNASGDVSLKKMNLIYAENGCGKTTLSRIIYSLGTGNADVIQHHRRFGATSACIVSVREDTGRSFDFDGSQWNKSMPSIEVFDSRFVDDNVYTGFNINNDHRRNLYKFVLGNTGVKIAKKIERVKSHIESKNRERANYNEQIYSLTNSHDVDSICNLEFKENIDQLIASKSEELKRTLNNDEILKRQLLPLPRFQELELSFSGEDVQDALSTSVDGIGNDYMNIVKAHIADLHQAGISNSQQWIFAGLKVIDQTKKNECPFCGNSIDGIDLIKGYNQFFSEKYVKTVEFITTIRDGVLSFKMELLIEKINTFRTQFEDLNAFWTKYIETEVEVPTFSYNVDTLRQYFDSLKKAIIYKSENPTVGISTEPAASFFSELKKLQDLLDKFNYYISLINGRISSLRQNIRKVEDVQKELKELQLIKDRFDGPLLRACNLYELTNKHLQKLNSINRKLQDSQKEDSNRVFETYGNKINYYLKDVFFTHFQLENVKDGGFRGRARESLLDYSLKFNDTHIHPEGDENTSFKNVLSEGDKNVIAFSFFLAKVTTDSDYSEKIIVFDDPLTSFDINRKQTTIFQLSSLYQHCKQVIVLSHNFHFMLELYKHAQIRKRDKKVLRIACDAGKSAIQEFAFNDEGVYKYHKNLVALENFLSDPSDNEKQEEALKAIRVCIETFLKLKYCKYINDLDHTFGQIIEDLKTNNSCHFINANKDGVIANLKKLNDISWRQHHGTMEELDVYSEVSISPEEAKYYVSMALNLLNNEL